MRFEEVQAAAEGIRQRQQLTQIELLHLYWRDYTRERFGPGRPTNTTLYVPLALEECRVEIEVTAKRRGA